MAASRNLALPLPPRLQADLQALARLTRPDRPYTRRAFAEHLAAGARACGRSGRWASMPPR